jgi:hypothetical protein
VPEKSPNTCTASDRSLGHAPSGTAPLLYEDNASIIKMINAGKPTERSRHINIQHFAMQDW